MIKRMVLKIHGFVQGVSYRYYSSYFAKSSGVKGYVKNESDGTVILVAEGKMEDLHKILNYCYNGIKYANVEKIEVSWEAATGEFIDFSVRY